MCVSILALVQHKYMVDNVTRTLAQFGGVWAGPSIGFTLEFCMASCS